MAYSRATDGFWQCPHCELWYDDDDDHDVELCESDRDEAADHKRRQRIEDAAD